MQTAEYTIRGFSPLLLQSDTLADPISPASKELKTFSGKRKKTDADYEEMARIEWHANIYLNDDGAPCIPAANIQRMLRDAGTLHKNGKTIERACMMVDEQYPIDYEGPKSADELFASGQFLDRRTVVVSRARVVRTRPIFRQWALTFSVAFDPEHINRETLDSTVHDAGRFVGLGTYRPRFGRFEVVQ